MTQQSPPAFPEGPLEPGKSWASKPTRMASAAGNDRARPIVHVPGPGSQGSQSDADHHGRPSERSSPRANVTAKIRAQEGKGTLTFDKLRGRLISSRGTQKTEMVIVAQGQEGDQTTETTSVMTLVP